jgi:rhodanese-related sulfurtransferase
MLKPKAHSPRFLALVEEAMLRQSIIQPEELAERLGRGEKPIIVDVREESEWEIEGIPGSVRLPKGIIERDIEKTVPDVGSEIILYCSGGFRSILAAENLQRMGYRNLKSVRDGLRGWQELQAKGS